MSTLVLQNTKSGLGYWMQQVVSNVDRALLKFSPDAVHDLRTALRRCRSLAEGIMFFDGDPRWKKMKRAGKQLFQGLGELRDTHVLLDWIRKLTPENDSTAAALQASLKRREIELKATAVASLRQFDGSQWNAWSVELPSRIAKLPPDSLFFAHLALERWSQARELHHRALQNRTNIAFHDLRIGIKYLRYTVENFLPGLHEFWSADLKEVQDALGDVHDLDVLWETASTLNAFPDVGSRNAWRDRILTARRERLDSYRRLMVGRNSLWKVWRAALPKDGQIHHLGLLRLERWAGSVDPDTRHSRHVAHLALQVFDALSATIPAGSRERYRSILRGASLMHEVGRAKCKKGHHKESARLIRKLRVPLGWASSELEELALVVRYHRGALPSDTQRQFSKLSQKRRETVRLLSGVLRLACACDAEHTSQIRNLAVDSTPPVVNIRAHGYVAEGPMVERLASARCLLEIACQRPVLIAPSESNPEIVN